ncbi:MAG: LysM peptidoglycan-binding domain-containing protein [Micavibrio aeruginosavorus]|nr:LysM peptidoglycan-binding domain-containing protein [Micavibrio aeruginosavorus]
MSGNPRLRKALAAFGLSLVTLTGAFNSSAQPTEQQPVATQKATIKPEQATLSRQEQLDIKMAASFASIEQLVKRKMTSDPAYTVEKDPVVLRKMDEILALLDQGADPNSYRGDGISFMGATGLTPFYAAIILSQGAQKPDFVQRFLDKGANGHMKAPDNWGAMDYAASNLRESQSVSRKAIDIAVDIMTALTRAGGRLDEAAEIGKRSPHKIQTYGDLAEHIIAAEIFREKGLITNDELQRWTREADALKEKVKKTVSLTDEWIKANGGQLNNYPDAVPGGPEPYIVQTGETLQDIAARFKDTMAMPGTQQAVNALAKQNSLAPDARLEAGKTILIPMPVGRQLGSLTVRGNTSLMDLAKILRGTYYDSAATTEDIARELARMNGLDPEKINEKGLVKKGQTLISAYVNDVHLLYKPLTPPAHYKGGREVDLVVIESKMDPSEVYDHAKDTYRVASSITYAVNPTADLTQIHSWASMLDYPARDNSDALDMLLDSAGSPINDRVIFSYSMAVKIPAARAQFNRQSRPEEGSMSYALISRYAQQMEESRPIIFAASGNFNIEEGRHVQSHDIVHSPRTVLIGAAGDYGGEKTTIAPYSSYGADVCAPLPRHMREQMEGTSFATPLTAALYRQFNEWYGDILTFEEIMAAGMMTADYNILDTNPPDQADMLMPGSRDKNPAKFITNGGGIPNHDRCGAGVLNAEKWQIALNKMVTIKQSLSRPAEEHSYRLKAGVPVIVKPTGDGGKTRYVYRMTVPHALTMGKLTLNLPQGQGKHSEIVVRTPAGFEKHLGYTHTDILSTFAFAYEDVKAGDVIEIMTTEPLGPSAGAILRGHTPGNTIAMLRDHLRAQGALPAPLQTMLSGKAAGPAAPVAPKALKEAIGPRLPEKKPAPEIPPMPLLPAPNMPDPKSAPAP